MIHRLQPSLARSDGVALGLLALVLLLNASPGTSAQGVVNCPPAPGTPGAQVDTDGDGVNDAFKFNVIPAGVPGPANQYCLVCVDSGVDYFLLKCMGFWTHRCPHVGAWNVYGVNPATGKYRSSSTEGATGPNDPGSDADGDGVVEKTCYELVCVNGATKLKVTVKHDGVEAGSRIVDPPANPKDLPWPDDIAPVPDQGGGAVLSGQWLASFMGVLVLTCACLAIGVGQQRRGSRRVAMAMIGLAIGLMTLFALTVGRDVEEIGARVSTRGRAVALRPISGTEVIAAGPMRQVVTGTVSIGDVSMVVTHNILTPNPNPANTKGLEVRVVDPGGVVFGGVVFPWYDPRASNDYGIADLGGNQFLLRVQPGAFEKFFLLDANPGGTAGPVEPALFPVATLPFVFRPLVSEPSLATDTSQQSMDSQPALGDPGGSVLLDVAVDGSPSPYVLDVSLTDGGHGTALILLAGFNGFAFGGLPTPWGGSVDVAGPAVLTDGVGFTSSPLDQFSRTDFLFGISVPVSFAGLTGLTMQAVHQNPFAPPFFFDNTIARRAAFPTTITTVMNGSGAPDDGFFQQDLINPIQFYGVARTSLFVGTNGQVTFNAGSGDFSPTLGEFFAGFQVIPSVPPNAGVAVLWGDYNRAGMEGDYVISENVLSGTTKVAFHDQNWWDSQTPAGAFSVEFGSLGSPTLIMDHSAAFGGVSGVDQNPIIGVTNGSGSPGGDPGSGLVGYVSPAAGDSAGHQYIGAGSAPGDQLPIGVTTWMDVNQNGSWMIF